MSETGAIVLDTEEAAADAPDPRADLAALGAALLKEPITVSAHRQIDGALRRCYLWDVPMGPLAEISLGDIAGRAGTTPEFKGKAVEILRLSPLRTILGPAHGSVPDFHYVVHTDVDDGWEDELNAWYETEHLPGLAAVPGVVSARRFVNLDTKHPGAAPRYYACYQLTAPEVLGSPAWLVVRGTDWSSRVRPHFRDTRRTMFRTLGV
jgi:hypothetical protein